MDWLVLIGPSVELIAHGIATRIEWNGDPATLHGWQRIVRRAHDDLVREKRPRAGEGYFLPGPWEKLEKPHPPVSQWTLPLYEIDPKAKRPPLDLVLPLEPHHRLFEKAYERVSKGDEP